MDDATPQGRKCWHCGEVKPLSEFYSSPRKRRKCRACSREWLREYMRERVEFLRDYKLAKGCADCGYKEHSCALDFDHRPGEVKLFEPSKLKTSGTWQQMLDEIAKCDVVCSNCHRVRTFITREPANRQSDLRVKPVVLGSYSDDGMQPPLFPHDPAA